MEYKQQKWILSLIAGLLFMIISSPYFYGLTNYFTSSFGFDIAGATKGWEGCPNLAGLIIHSILFVLIVRAIMR